MIAPALAAPDLRMARLAASVERGLRRLRERLAAAEMARDSAIERLNAIAADIAAVDGQLEILPEGDDRDAMLASREALVDEDTAERALMTEAEASIARIETQISGAEADLAAVADAAADVLDPKQEIDTAAIAAEGRRLLDQYDALGAEQQTLVSEFNDIIAARDEMTARYDEIWAEGSAIYADGPEADDLYREQDAIFDDFVKWRARLSAIDARLSIVDAERARIADEMDVLAGRLMAAKPRSEAD